MQRRSRNYIWLRQPNPLVDWSACRRCHGLIEAGMRNCPTCGQWLGPGIPALWMAMVMVGGSLITAAFFLPWLTGLRLGREQVLSGYDLARIAQYLATSTDSRPTAAASIALYLAPAAGLTMVVLLGLAQASRLPWSIVVRLLVGLTAIPCQLALLAALFSIGLLGENPVRAWPHIGLISTGLGSLLAFAGAIALGGPGRPFRIGQPARFLTDPSRNGE